MDTHRVAEMSEGAGSSIVCGECQAESVGNILGVNPHNGKAYLGIHLCFCYSCYLQSIIGSKANTSMSFEKMWVWGFFH